MCQRATVGWHNHTTVPSASNLLVNTKALLLFTTLNRFQVCLPYVQEDARLHCLSVDSFSLGSSQLDCSDMQLSRSLQWRNARARYRYVECDLSIRPRAYFFAVNTEQLEFNCMSLCPGHGKLLASYPNGTQAETCGAGKTPPILTL